MLAIARDKVPYVIKICYPGTKCAHFTDRWDFQYRTRTIFDQPLLELNNLFDATTSKC